eukprot:JP446885.1.p1 GENE.JP446885.1~~JP446885.1.p1  ORF type:complete len:200 (-),score=20.97 JP446885.1:9-608(-)
MDDTDESDAGEPAAEEHTKDGRHKYIKVDPQVKQLAVDIYVSRYKPVSIATRNQGYRRCVNELRALHTQFKNLTHSQLRLWVTSGGAHKPRAGRPNVLSDEELELVHDTIKQTASSGLSAVSRLMRVAVHAVLLQNCPWVLKENGGFVNFVAESTMLQYWFCDAPGYNCSPQATRQLGETEGRHNYPCCHCELAGENYQ